MIARSSFKRCGDSPEEPEKTTSAAKASVTPPLKTGARFQSNSAAIVADTTAATSIAAGLECSGTGWTPDVSPI